MDFAIHALKPEIVARNIELAAAIATLPLEKAEAVLNGIRDNIGTANGPKITWEDYNAFCDALAIRAHPRE